MVVALPETVKTTRVGMVLPAPTLLVGERFPLLLGPNEVMVLLSIYYWSYGTLVAGVNRIRVGLWRKTDVDPPGSIWVDGGSPDMVWSTMLGYTFVTESLVHSKNEHIVLPWPLILIRPPRLLADSTLMTAVTIDMRLYYLIQQISDEELAKLMVKDHA